MGFFDPRSKFAKGVGASDESAPHPSLTVNNSCGHDGSREKEQNTERNSVFWQADKKILQGGKSSADVKKREAAKLPASQPTLKSSRGG